MSQDTTVATPKYKMECRKPIFFDSFADGVADGSMWSEDAGNWAVSSQTQYDDTTGYVYTQDNVAADRVSTTKDLTAWTDHYAIMAFKILTASGSVGLVFRKSDSTYYSFKVTQGTTNNLKLEKEDGTQIGDLASQTIAQNTWYMARIRCSGTQIYCDTSTDFEDFTNRIDTTDSSYSSGFAALKTYQTSAYFDAVEAFELKKTLTEATNTDLISFDINSSTSTSADTFSLILRNQDGSNTSLCLPGYEIHVWAGYAENSPDLNKIFVGTIEEPTPSLNDSSGDILNVSGHDLIIELLSQPVTEVYYDQTVEYIVKDLVGKYCENITAGLNVQSTSNTLSRISFMHKSLFECLKELALEGDGINSYDFWIDLKKDLNFKQKGTISSGKTLTVGTNILAHNFGPSINGISDTIKVYGKGKPDTTNVVEQTTSNNTIDFGKSTTYQKIAQTFVLNDSQMFDFVVKPQASTGSPTSDIVFELQETSAGIPTGHVLASHIVKNADWAQAISDTADITVALDASITPASTYAIVLRTKENALDDSNYYAVGINTAGGYAGGERIYHNGTIWTGTGSGHDFYFKAYPRLPNALKWTNTLTKNTYKIHRTYEDWEKLDEIRNYAELKARAQIIYNEKTIVPYEGTITTFGLDDVRAGQTVDVVIPNSNIDDTYQIIELTHTISRSGYTSTVTLNTRLETITDVISAHEKRITQLEAKDILDHETLPQIEQLYETLILTNDPENNLGMYDRTINTTDTWFFGKPHQFSEPIKFGGGSGQYGSNQIEDASS